MGPPRSATGDLLTPSALRMCSNRGVLFGHPTSCIHLAFSWLRRNCGGLAVLVQPSALFGSTRSYSTRLSIRRSVEPKLFFPYPFLKTHRSPDIPARLLRESRLVFNCHLHHGFAPWDRLYGAPGELFRLCGLSQGYRACRDLHAREPSPGYGKSTFQHMS